MIILHPFYSWDNCCDGDTAGGDPSDPLFVEVISSCEQPVKVEICANSSGEYDPILLCDAATGNPVIATIGFDETGAFTSTLHNIDGSAFTGAAVKCDSNDLELNNVPICVDGVQFNRIDIVDPSTTPASVSGSIWQDITGAVVADPTPTATEVKQGVCQNNCLQPVGVCKCYGDDSASSAEYINPDNNTDISFSHNSTTIKWETNGSDGADAFTLAIVACINSGNVANISLVGANGVNTTFAADAIVSNGNGDGTGNYAFTGVGPGSFSDKLSEAYLACGDEAGLSEACKYENCETGEVIWKDVYTDAILTAEQIETLKDCEITLPEDCEETTTEIVLCAAEAVTDPDAGAIAIGDQILYITKVDCENVIVSSKAYLLPSGAEVTGTILTDVCDPQPDVETIRECIKDVNGVQWTQLNIIDPTDGTIIASLFYDASQTLGTPTGEPSTWTSCECKSFQLVSYWDLNVEDAESNPIAITNGSFEDPLIPPAVLPTPGQLLFWSRVLVPGWTSNAVDGSNSANNIEMWNDREGVSACDGDVFVEINSNAPARLSSDPLTVPSGAGILRWKACHHMRNINGETVNIARVLVGDHADPPVVATMTANLGDGWNINTGDVAKECGVTEVGIAFETVYPSGSNGNFIDGIELEFIAIKGGEKKGKIDCDGVLTNIITGEVVDIETVTLCDPSCGAEGASADTFDKVEHTITSGVNTQVPADFKTVRIQCTSGTIIINGTYHLHARADNNGPVYDRTIVFDATESDRVDACLPSISIAGSPTGTWEWISLDNVEV